MRNKNSFVLRLMAILMVCCMSVGILPVVSSAVDTTLTQVDPAAAVGEYVIPDGTVAIANNAFSGCDELTSVVIPASVKTIGDYAFSGCTALASVRFNGSLDSVGLLAFQDTAWYNNYPTDFVYASSPSGFNVLVGYKGTDEEVTVPASTTMIADGAFYNNKTITSVTIPLRTTEVGDYAFYGCEKLEDITIKGALDECGFMAFEDTAWLNSFAGEFVISGTMLIKYNGDKDVVYVPNTVTKIASYAFYDCTDVTTVRVPASVTDIGTNAFYLYNDGGNDKYAEIYCWADTYAETYAQENGLTISSYMNYPGDINGDGNVHTSDARIALRYAAKLERDLTDTQFIAGDIGCDDVINSADARLILRMATGLADYTPTDLLFKPNTDFEILMAYTESVRLAYIKEAGYNLQEYQSIDEVKVGPSIIRTTLNNPFKTDLTSEDKAEVQALSSDTVEALEQLYLCDLTNNSIIKEADCVLSESNKYYITIVLNDEVDVEGTDSLTSCMFPVVAREDMNRLLEEEEGIWYNAANTDFNYEITYQNCTLDAIVDVSTGNIENLEMKMGYRFDVWGQIRLTKIRHSDDRNNPVGYATRTDTVIYSDFDYTVAEFTTTTTEPTTIVEGEDPENPVTVPSTTSNNDAGNFLAGIGDSLSGLLGGLFG